MFTLAISCLTTYNLINGPNLPGFYAVLLFATSDFITVTSHIDNWVLFLLWLRLFILSGGISPLFSSSIWGTYRPVEFIFQCTIFLPFHAVHGILKQEYWSGFPFPSPVGHVWSELSTMIHLSRVALHGIAHSFTELEKLEWLTLLKRAIESEINSIYEVNGKASMPSFTSLSFNKVFGVGSGFHSWAELGGAAFHIS